MRLHTLAVLAAVLGPPVSASATVWTSQTLFDTAYPGLPMANFDYLTSRVDADHGLVQLSDNPYVNGGVTFSTPNGSGDFYLVNDEYYGGPSSSPALAGNTYGDTLTLSFSPVSEIGLVVAQSLPDTGAGYGDFSVYDGDTKLLAVTETVNDFASPNFIGFSGLGPITSVVFDTSAYGAPEFPNVLSVDGVQGAVPEPASWALMLVGLAGLGGVLRRRRGAGDGRIRSEALGNRVIGS